MHTLHCEARLLAWKGLVLDVLMWAVSIAFI